MKAKVVLQVPRILVSLLQNLEGVDQVIGDQESAQNIDLVLPLMSLPNRLNLTEADFVVKGPYLHSPKTKKQLLPIKDKSSPLIKLGLVWQGGHRETLSNTWATHQRRNIPLKMLAQLAHPDISFFSLQKGSLALQELHELKKSPTHFDVFESELGDFTDTADIIDQLDLVITVDTSVAHLAGAMAKPVWILNRFDGCWRWLRHRQETPWYTSAKLYFQQDPGDWQGVIDQVKQDLEVFISERR
jgi:ADP-heptose:LPS heptosyltransferase